MPEFVIRDRGVNLQGALLNTILCFDVTLRCMYGKVGLLMGLPSPHTYTFTQDRVNRAGGRGTGHLSSRCYFRRGDIMQISLACQIKSGSLHLPTLKVVD